MHGTIFVRTPSTYAHLEEPNVTILASDAAAKSEELSQKFSSFDTIISATGFEQAAGTGAKRAKEIHRAGELRAAAGKGRLWFFPWQWGIDYDATGDGGGLIPLFDEQVEVRNLLRERAGKPNVEWTALSVGISMSFRSSRSRALSTGRRTTSRSEL